MNFLTAKSLKKSASANLLFTSGARSRSSWHAWTNWSQRTAKKNSTNSSKPPSSDGLAGEQRPRGRKHKSKRKPGAQPGHPGHHRPLVPSAAASAIEVLLPKQCGHCGASLPQEPGKVTTAGDPRRHQVTEVPPVKAHITEY